MNKNIIKFFNLPEGIWVDKIETFENLITIQCRQPGKYASCPTCGSRTDRIHKWRYRELKHGKADDRIVYLELKVRQFKCRRCHGKLFTEQFKGIDKRHSTENFRRLTIKWLQRNSFNFTGKQFSVSGTTLNRISTGINQQIKINWQELAKKKIILGVDEHSYRGRDLLITLTAPSHRKLLEILKDDRQASLDNWIENIPELAKKQITEVCMDLKATYKNSFERLLPNAMIVADRFHVEQLANRLVDQIRAVVTELHPGRTHIKEILLKGREKLTPKEKIKLEFVFLRFKKYPALYQAWFIKEKIRDMYRLKNKDTAREKFSHVLTLLMDADCSRYFRPFLQTLKFWKENILNYFNNRSTNAFTEGVHTKIKLMKRVSFGFRNVFNYISKMTLAFLPPLLILALHHL